MVGRTGDASPVSPAVVTPLVLVMYGVLKHYKRLIVSH